MTNDINLLIWKCKNGEEQLIGIDGMVGTHMRYEEKAKKTIQGIQTLISYHFKSYKRVPKRREDWDVACRRWRHERIIDNRLTIYKPSIFPVAPTQGHRLEVPRLAQSLCCAGLLPCWAWLWPCWLQVRTFPHQKQNEWTCRQNFQGSLCRCRACFYGWWWPYLWCEKRKSNSQRN